MAIATAFIAFLLVLPAIYAVDYSVGDSGGWSLGMDYTTWSAAKTFNIGDTLLFNYVGSHGVDVVSKEDYDSCTTGNALASHRDGSTVITLSKVGPMYFICPAMGHCSGGMKLAVTVSAASTIPSNGTATTPSTRTPLPTTPSTETPSSTTPSTETPSGITPSTHGTPSSTTPSTETPSGTTSSTHETPSSTTPSTETPSGTTPSTEIPSGTTPSTEIPSGTTPSTETPSGTNNLAGTNGASSNLYNVNYMFGACLVLAPLLVLMG